MGTGLGLSLSYDIVKAHGREIKVETKDGEGSEFIIQLPNNSPLRGWGPFRTTKPTGQGTVKGHGGKIEFQTEENARTEFIITVEQFNLG